MPCTLGCVAQATEGRTNTLIEELEAQELEIERLFKDNHELGRQCLEAQERAMSWKDMCTDLATQNERLQYDVRAALVVEHHGALRGEGPQGHIELLRNAPPALNLSGVGDVLCFHTAHFAKRGRSVVTRYCTPLQLL